MTARDDARIEFSTEDQQQIERETAMLRDGLARAIRRDQSASASGDQTRAERLTLAALIPAASDYLTGLIGSYDGLPGSRPGWLAVVKALDVDEVAAAAIRSAFSSALKRAPLARSLRTAGIHLEVMHAHRVATGGTRARRRRNLAAAVKGSPTQRGRRRVVMEAADPVHQAWDDVTLAHMGEPLMNAALATGLFEIVEGSKRAREQHAFGLSAAGRDMVAEVDAQGLHAPAILRPMLVPARPWTGLQDGGYLSPALARHATFVRGPIPEQTRLLKVGIDKGNMGGIMRSTSALGQVPFRIRRDILDLRNWCVDAGIAIPDVLPLRTPVEVPEAPADDAAPEVKRRLYGQRKRAALVNEGIAPNLLAFHAQTAEAESLRDAPAFYLPHNLDKRGRTYPLPVFSHHQGDATKALFEFARGRALGEDGLWWLSVHLANCGDFGKISKRPYAERVLWVLDNRDTILDVAEDPRTNLQWLEADAPFSFVAACQEYAAAIYHEAGAEAFVSHLPVALDGSNSGVQHYSAAQRAEEGRLVNLTDEDAPQDLYQAVADKVAADCGRYARMAAQALGKPLEGLDWLAGMDAALASLEAVTALAKAEERELNKAEQRACVPLKRRVDLVASVLWHQQGIGRSTVKRNVMTFGYSSEAFGMAQQIRTDFMDPLALRVLQGELPAHPFGSDEGRAAAMFLGRRVYSACKRVLPRVAQAMQWLQQAATVLAAEEKGLLMITPLGFPMLQKYTEWQVKTVELKLIDRTSPICGHSTLVERFAAPRKRVEVNMRVSPGRAVLKHKQASGAAPNVIHACDATHLHMVVLDMVEHRGIPDLLLIHDSFATHAGAVPALNESLRETFVALYDTWSPLEDVRDRAVKALTPGGAALLPEVPARGGLDLSEVRRSQFCFS